MVDSLATGALYEDQYPAALEKVGIRCQKAPTASGEVYTCQARTLTVGQECVLHLHPSWLGRACSQARHQKPAASLLGRPPHFTGALARLSSAHPS